MAGLDLVADYRATRERVRGDGHASLREISEFANRHDGGEVSLAAANLLRANHALSLSEYDEAERFARLALVAARAKQVDPLISAAELLLGTTALERGDLLGATERYEESARRLAPQDRGELARVYNNLGLVAWRLRDHPLAVEHYGRALHYFGPEAPPRIVGNLLNNLGLVYEDQGLREEAERAFRNAANTLEGAGDDSFLANALSNLGELVARRSPEEAQLLHERALSLRLSVRHQRGVVRSRIELARLALRRGDPHAARQEADEALAVARRIGVRQLEADALELRATVGELHGDPIAALADLRSCFSIREELNSALLAERVSALHGRFVNWQTRLDAQRAETERARIAEAMRAVEAAAEVKSRFLAMMSHELRTPLTSVIGAAELLRLERLEPMQARLVNVIATGAEALLSTISDVLDFSKAESQGVELRVEAVAPLDVLEGVMRLLEREATSRGLSLTLTVAEGMPRALLLDRARVRHILLNLVMNALKFTDQGGVRLLADYRDGALVLEVIDTGIGIEPERLRDIFEPFLQLDSSNTRRHGGLGLGLAIVQRLATAMGGIVTAESARGVGSRMVATIPAQLAPGMPAIAPRPEGASVGRFSVVLIDDDDDVREILTELLAFCGGSVMAFGSGRLGLDQALKERPDAVLLDLHMPGMDGLTCTRALRRRHGEELFIIAVSGAVSDLDRSRANEAGVSGFLAKPLGLAELQRELTRLGLFPGP